MCSLDGLDRRTPKQLLGVKNRHSGRELPCDDLRGVDLEQFYRVRRAGLARLDDGRLDGDGRLDDGRGLGARFPVSVEGALKVG